VHDGPRVAERPCVHLRPLDIPESSITHRFPACAASRLMRSPWIEMSTQRYRMAALPRTRFTQNLIGDPSARSGTPTSLARQRSGFNQSETGLWVRPAACCGSVTSKLALDSRSPAGSDWCPQDAVATPATYSSPDQRSPPIGTAEPHGFHDQQPPEHGRTAYQRQVKESTMKAL
jgi:hypothetical protein